MNQVKMEKRCNRFSVPLSESYTFMMFSCGILSLFLSLTISLLMTYQGYSGDVGTPGSKGPQGFPVSNERSSVVVNAIKNRQYSQVFH